jgi:hypothetical protein
MILVTQISLIDFGGVREHVADKHIVHFALQTSEIKRAGRCDNIYSGKSHRLLTSSGVSGEVLHRVMDGILARKARH